MNGEGQASLTVVDSATLGSHGIGHLKQATQGKTIPRHFAHPTSHRYAVMRPCYCNFGILRRVPKGLRSFYREN